MKKWRGKTIDIYIFKQIVKPFLVGVGIIGVIMLSSFLYQLADLIIVKNIPLIEVLQLLFYQLPEIIVQTFPMAVLFAVISGLGRLSRENEFTALRMGGVSIYRLIIPLLVFGLIVSGMTYMLNEEIVPWSNHKARNIVRVSMLQETNPEIQEDVFFEGPRDRLFYVTEYDEDAGELRRVVIFELPDDGKFPEVITAARGYVGESTWRLEEGFIHSYDRDGYLELESNFGEMEVEITRDVENFFGQQRTPSEMSREELSEEISLFRDSGIDVTSLLVEYHLKLAVPFTPLIFVLLGTPLSLGNKESRALDIVFTIIVIFLYYLILSLSRSLGRNGMINPLLSAWLPNGIFVVLGVILLIWREAWQGFLINYLPRLLPFVIVFLLLVGGFTSPAAAEEVGPDKLRLKADHLEYHSEKGEIEALGNIMSQYGLFYIQTDELTVVLEDGEKRRYDAREIELARSNFSGCDQKEQHYYFEADSVTIHPDDHLVARNVTFWELKGRLPLFYWPYLYISLKEREQHLIPEVGYNARRGWFAKFTYNYWYDDRLPGEIYLDYYTISGSGYGFKQYFLEEEDREGYIYYYNQENKTDIPGLFDWEGEFKYSDSRGDWQPDFNVDYTVYDNYRDLDGEVDLEQDGKKREINLASDFSDKAYYEDTGRDERNLDLDFDYKRYFENDWELDLNFNRDFIQDPEDGIKSRWGSRSYLAQRGTDYDFRVEVERFAPRFTEDGEEEDGVVFYRWPELSLDYFPNYNINYELAFGHYYEDRSGIEGQRLAAEIDYNNNWQPTNWLNFSTEQVAGGRDYREIIEESGDKLPYRQAYYNPQYGIKTDITDHLSWDNSYEYYDNWGQTPFNFDEEETKEEVKSTLNYRRGGFDFELKSGYDIHMAEYMDLEILLDWQLTDHWNLDTGTYYDFNDREYGDLAVTTEYDDEKRLEAGSGLRYDPNLGQLEEWDNSLQYTVDDLWEIQMLSSYDFTDDEFDRARFAVKKTFHCRDLWFSYDYVQEEVMLEYRINLLPEHGFKVGREGEDELIFDLGIRDLLGL
ncbi:MAG: LptF/LptG family permease [Bacillota bacterium]